MGENDKIVTRYMADRDFQAAAYPILAREIFDAVRANRAGETGRGAPRRRPRGRILEHRPRNDYPLGAQRYNPRPPSWCGPTPGMAFSVLRTIHLGRGQSTIRLPSVLGKATMKRAHKGTMQLVERKSGLQVWVYRWFEKDQAGEPWRRKRALGAITRFKSETAAWREVERLGLGRSFDESGPRNLKELVDHYTQKELDTEPGKERLAFATSETYRLMLKNWVMPRWGAYPLDDIKVVAVEEWLGNLQRTVGEEKIDLAPGSKKKIRDVMHVLFKHAIRYEWMDRNP